MLMREVVPRGAFGLAPPGALTALAARCQRQVAFTRLRAKACFRRRSQDPSGPAG